MPRRGDVYGADLGEPRGGEQAFPHPVLILQDDTLAGSWRTVVVIPFTSNLDLADWPTCVHIPAGAGGLTVESVAMCHQIRALARESITYHMGTLPDELVTEIENALIRTLRL